MAGGAAAAILNSGVLTVSGGSNSITINVGPGVPMATNTFYVLVNYTGTSILGTGNSAFRLGTIAGTNSRQMGSLDFSVAGEIRLDITGDTPKWTGFDTTANAVSSRWVPNDTLLAQPVTDWQLINTPAPTSYIEGDTVLFDDTAIGSKTVSLNDGDVHPGSVTVNNSTGASNVYTFNGINSIAGTTSFIKSGTGTVVINNTNTFTGGVTLNNGVMTLGTAGAIGTTNVVTFDSAAPAGTKLQLNGNNIQVGGLVEAGTNGVVENGAAAAPAS